MGRMSFLQADFSSSTLGLATGVNVIIPTYEPKSVLYLLHGLSDDQTLWSRKSSIERYAEEANIAVIMPTTYRGFYTDTKYGMKYWTYISEELPEYIKNTFRLPTEREKTFVAGLSMGGYGTLKLALRKPEMFTAAYAMSSAADIKVWHERNDEAKYIFGETVPDEEDLFCLASTYKNNTDKLPKIYMRCGESDGLLPYNRKLAEHMKDLGIDVDYKESPGVHDWKYWDEQIKNFIDIIK